jgi:hypothetical protein
MAAAEILASGTIAEDASAPAVVSSNTLTALTTASFTPPDGSLIVVLIGSDGDGSGTTTMAVTDTGGLTWTPLAQANASNQEYAGVWVAQVPSGSTSGPNSPSTGTDLGGGTGTWTSPGNITADDGSAATWAVV